MTSRAGIAWMALSALLFALMGFFARLASEGVHWTLVGGSRALVGAVVAYAVARARGAPMRVRDRRGIWLRSLFGTASMAATFYALADKSLSLGDTVTLFNLSPVFIALMSPIVLGERSGKRVAVALVLSLAGVVLILHPPFLFGGTHLSHGATRTAMVAVLAAFTSACAMMMLRKIGPRESAESIAIHFSLFAAAVFFVASLPSFALPSAKNALYLAGAGLSAGFAQLAMTRAYALERAAYVGSIGYLGVVVSALLGALALHEWPKPSATLGMALVVAGGLVVALLNAPAARTAPGVVAPEDKA